MHACPPWFMRIIQLVSRVGWRQACRAPWQQRVDHKFSVRSLVGWPVGQALLAAPRRSKPMPWHQTRRHRRQNLTQLTPQEICLMKSRTRLVDVAQHADGVGGGRRLPLQHLVDAVHHGRLEQGPEGQDDEVEAQDELRTCCWSCLSQQCANGCTFAAHVAMVCRSHHQPPVCRS